MVAGTATAAGAETFNQDYLVEDSEAAKSIGVTVRKADKAYFSAEIYDETAKKTRGDKPWLLELYSKDCPHC